MAKTYKILVNDGKGTEIKPVSVEQGVGAKGEPVRLVAKRGWRFQLQDDFKGNGLAPDQVRLKRVGKDLAILLDGSERADVVIENYYAENTDKDKDNGMPSLVGTAENGSTYEYVPQDPAVNSMPAELKNDNTPVIVSLGGGPLGDDFVLSALPLVAAAGGVSGWLVAGGVAAAAAAGGGGGGSGAAVVVVPAKATGSLTHDATNDTGTSQTDSLTKNTTPVLTINAEKGATVLVTVNGKEYTATETSTPGVYTVKVGGKETSGKLSDGVYTPVIKVSNSSGSTTSDGTPFTVDLSTFTEPNPVDPFNPPVPNISGLRVTIDTDANNDGVISNAELPNSKLVTATVALTKDAAVGDVLTITVTGNTTRTIPLEAADIQSGKVVLTDLAAPADGSEIKVTASIKDAAGNTSPTPDASDAATVNAAKLAVSILSDENNDGFINKAESEKISKISVKVEIPNGAVVGDKITVSDGTTTLEKTLDSTDVAAKSFTLTDAFNKPAEGKDIVVTATRINNGTTTTANDKATLDTSAFIDPLKPDPFNPVDPKKTGLRVLIDTDANNDGILDNAELPASNTPVKTTVALTKDAAVGDLLTIAATGNTTRQIMLTTTDITNGKVELTDLVAPADGSTLTVEASIQDKAKNRSPSVASDSATVDAAIPGVLIINDTNNDGFISNAESATASKVSVKVNVPKNAVAKDIVTVTDGKKTVSHELTAAEVTAKSFTLTDTDAFEKPAQGRTIVVTASYAGKSASDSATLDARDLTGLKVEIDSDINNDGIINADEMSKITGGKLQATISLSSGAAVGDIITANVTGNAPQTFTVTQQQKTAGKIVLTGLTAPADGSAIKVTATINDKAGNGPVTAEDSAMLDASVPNDGKAPDVVITTDSNNDLFVNKNEADAPSTYTVRAVFTKVALNDIVVFTSGGTTKEVKLTQTDVDNGFVETSYSAPAKGDKLKVDVFIKDLGGNASSTGSDEATHNFLDAVADTNKVTASSSGQTVKIIGNVIVGDGSGVGKDIDPQFFGANGYGTNVIVNSVKKGDATSTTSFDLLVTKGGKVQGDFGTLTIAADGTYDYVLDSNAKVSALLDGEKVMEVFTYKVKDAGGNESEATLFIEVKGVNDAATVEIKGRVSTFDVSALHVGLAETVDNMLTITDADAGQAKFDGVSATTASVFNLKYGSLTLTQTSSTSTSTGYKFKYDKNTLGLTDSADTVRHDLFTLQSSDGTATQTLDFELLSSGTSTNKQEFRTSSTTGLKITSTSTSKTDTLVLDGAQLSFDFTAPTPVGASTPNITSIEKVNITGTGSNTIKLSLDSLVQADTVSLAVDGSTLSVHRLFIDGDSNDAVQLNRSLGTPSNHVAPTAGTGALSGYNIYHFDATHELLIQQSITSITFTG